MRRLTFTGLRGVDAPLLPVGLAFVGGIAASTEISPRPVLWVGLALGFWVLTPFLEWRVGRWPTTLALLGCFISLGGGLQSLRETALSRDSPRVLFECGALEIAEPVEIRARLLADPELAPDRIYLHLELESLRSLQRSYPARGRVRIVVPFGDDRSRLEYDQLGIIYGERLRMIAQLRVRRQYGNPGAPPFDEILESQGLVATGWVRSPLLIEKLPSAGSGVVMACLYSLRSGAIRHILRQLPQPAAGLLLASLFGNQYFLGRDTAEPFRSGGTFHLLVISGLHMALIATAVFWLIGRVTGHRALQFGGCVLVMWGYGMMVGAQPAVTRAVVMLTLALLGRYLFRQLSGGNSLAGAGILLLAWQPGDLFNPGFQVSFLTVGVIVFVTGPIETRFREIGRWRPTARTPWPPRVRPAVALIAELLYWDGWRNLRERRRQKIRYRLFKARASLWLSRWRLQPVLRWVVMTVATTISIQVVLLPLMISGFHRVSLLSPLINVVEALLVTGLMGLGVLYLLIAPFLGGWVQGLVLLIDQTGRLAVDVGVRLAALPGGGWRVPDFGPSAPALYTVYGAALLILVHQTNSWNPLARGGHSGDPNRRRQLGWKWIQKTVVLIAVGLVAIIATMLITHPFSHQFEPGRLSLTFLDVGQGDAIVVTFPRGRLMMIDSGGDPVFRRESEDDGEPPFIEDRLGIAEAAVLPYLWSRGIDKLDWVVASHGDNDHIGGFSEVARSIRIGEAWLAKKAEGKFAAVMRNASVPLLRPEPGECREIDGVIVGVLAGGGADNNGSLVIRLTFGRRSFLLTGDIEKEAERALVASGGGLRADVLKVAHHGSATSSTPEFLDSTQAELAVISAGRNNPFGHPSALVTERLLARGMTVCETARDGAITISTDGTDLKKSTGADGH